MLGFIFTYAIDTIYGNLTDIGSYIDSKFENQKSSNLIFGTVITIVALKALAEICQKRWGESRREQLGRMALRFSYVKNQYDKDIGKELSHFKESVRQKWEKFGIPIISMPEKGWTYKDLKSLVERYTEKTLEQVKDKHLSGTIYSKNLISSDKKKVGKDYSETEIDDFKNIATKLKKLFKFSFGESYLWNSLHSDEFSIGAFLEYQVVRIVASMFASSPSNVMGFVTSGGTESLMLAMRAYRNWGIRTLGHKPGEGVIIACNTVHAAVIKASQAYLIKVVLVGADKEGRTDLELLKKALKEHKGKVVAIVGSAPSYPWGVIDPIKEMSEIAYQHKVGMHVDCCLGAFVINNLSQYNTNYLDYPGVTSLSADPHKNGWAPKGSSVLVTKSKEDKNLAEYAIYTVPGWSGGVYGTAKDAGSQSCVNSLHALLAMLAIGKEGYCKMAQEIHLAAQELANSILKFEGKLKLLAKPEVNVVAFQIDKAFNLEKGATYAFAYEMKKRKFILNTLKDEAVHFCVTERFAGNPNALNEFYKALEESLEAVRVLNEELKKGGKKFPGDAGMYCALENAMKPDMQQLSKRKYIENFLLGPQGANDGVRAHFLAQMDPGLTSRL